MAYSKAATVEEYLRELPAERRQTVEALRTVILDNLPGGYEEAMQFGMISYVVPLERYPQDLQRPSAELRRAGVPEELRLRLPDEHLQRR